MFFLQKIVKDLPCCLKDTNDFLSRSVAFSVEEVTWICTFDIKSLFTNIPYNEGCKAVRNKLCQNSSLYNRDVRFLMSLLDIILTRNYFRFGGQHYLQLQVASMGSPAAPSYANICFLVLRMRGSCPAPILIRL